MKVRTIDVNVKEWFDKANGNSYFAGVVTVNYGMKSEKRLLLPFQYGYGSHSEDMAFKLLIEKSILKSNGQYYRETWLSNCIVKSDIPKSFWQYYRDNNIIYRYNKQENCKLKELKSLSV